MKIKITLTMPVLIKDLGLKKSPNGDNRRCGIYKCMCGNEFETKSTYIKNGHTRSCGCLRKINIKKHGMSTHVVYVAWASMKSRCYLPKATGYENYGLRGIKVCDRWLNSFENFRDDMLPTWKEGLSLDRINNNGNYEPSNCRWVNNTTQNRNTRILKSNNKSGYRGVSWHKVSKKWHAQITINATTRNIGYFNDIIDAAKAYDKYVIDNNLEHTINSYI